MSCACVFVCVFGGGRRERAVSRLVDRNTCTSVPLLLRNSVAELRRLRGSSMLAALPLPALSTPTKERNMRAGTSLSNSRCSGKSMGWVASVAAANALFSLKLLAAAELAALEAPGSDPPAVSTLLNIPLPPAWSVSVLS
jgi:hypothetical protein